MITSGTTVVVMGRRLAAEALGSFLLIFTGVGTALWAANVGGDNAPILSTGYLGVALAFGLALVVASYAFGPISGGHFNPAVTLGLAAAGRFPWKDAPRYIAAQVVGSAVASSVLAGIVATKEGAWQEAQADGFASNGYGIGDFGSPHGFSWVGVGVTEFVLTALFLYIIIGATAKTASQSLAGLVVGLTLTLIHLVAIPVDNASVNPARSLATAIYGGADPWSQIWAFILFPVVGAVAAGLSWKYIGGRD